MTIAPNRRTIQNPAPLAASAGPGKMPARRTWVMGGVALVLVLAGYWFFNGRESGGEKQAAAAPVRVATVQQRDMAVIERSLGTVIANTMVQLTARVQGTLERQFFQEGQFVHKGQLLFQIDAKPFVAAAAQAQAVYARDQAQLQNALRDKQRYAALYAQQAISTQQRDIAETNANVLAATVAADKAALDAARLNVGYTQVRSPVDGKTGPVLVQPGNMINGTNSINGTNAALVSIAEVKPIKVSFTLPQSDLPRIQARQQSGKLIASLDVRDKKGQPLTAPVSFVSNAVSNQSGTIELRALFPNDDLALVPGQLVNVTVQLNDIPNALIVPRNAVNDSPNGPFVFVIRGGKAVVTPVNVLFDDGSNAAVAGQLQRGETVVTEGQLRVVPGGPVRILAAHAGAGGQPR